MTKDILEHSLWDIYEMSSRDLARYDNELFMDFVKDLRAAELEEIKKIGNVKLGEMLRVLKLPQADFISFMAGKKIFPNEVFLSETLFNIIITPLVENHVENERINSYLGGLLMRAAVALKIEGKNYACFPSPMYREIPDSKPPRYALDDENQPLDLEVTLRNREGIRSMIIGIEGEKKLQLQEKNIEEPVKYKNLSQ